MQKAFHLTVSGASRREHPGSGEGLDHCSEVVQLDGLDQKRIGAEDVRLLDAGCVIQRAECNLNHAIKKRNSSERFQDIEPAEDGEFDIEKQNGRRKFLMLNCR